MSKTSDFVNYWIDKDELFSQEWFTAFNLERHEDWLGEAAQKIVEDEDSRKLLVELEGMERKDRMLIILAAG